MITSSHHYSHVLTLVAVAGLAWLSCRAPAPPPSSSSPASADAPPSDPALGYPGWLRSPAVLGHDFLWQQHVSITYDEHTRSFDAALQKQGDTLTLVGLGPMGTPGFVITLQGDTISFENNTREELPFSPRYILLDVQRTFFPYLAAGQSTGTIEGETITEVHVDGRLSQRRFHRQSNEPQGEIVVDYEGWVDGADAPRKATLHNGWFGYRLTVETVSQQRL